MGFYFCIIIVLLLIIIDLIRSNTRYKQQNYEDQSDDGYCPISNDAEDFNEF